MLLNPANATRDLGRLHEIASVLVRHGLGDAVRRSGAARLLDRAGRALRWRAIEGLSKEPPVRLREALEQLGPTFVKLGQLLAGRSDLLPPDWTRELSKLHQRAQPVPFDELRAQLVEDLGSEPSAVFDDFDEEALAAASIAQVHRATTKDGTPVVLKVRRPGIEDVVQADLGLLARFAETAERRMPELRRFRPRSLVRQFARSLRGELDLRREARSAARLRANLAEQRGIVVPRVHSRWTTERLCVMDFLDGPSIGDWLESRETEPGERARMAALGADAVLHTVFVDGFFHADPHPGNVLVLPNGRLGLIDFGMIGSLPAARRREFLDLLVSIATHDVDRTVDVLLRWSDGDVDEELLAQDAAAFIDRYYGLSLREIDTRTLLGDLTALLRENDLFLPNEVALLLKVFVTLEGLGRRLDPNFVMTTRVEPFVRAAWRRHHSAGATVRRGARELSALLTALPRDLRRVAALARRGRFHVDIDVERLEQFGHTLDRSANRLTIGLVTSALIVGTSIALTVRGGPEIAGLPLFGFLGFTTSIAAGVWLLWSIFRSGHR